MSKSRCGPLLRVAVIPGTPAMGWTGISAAEKRSEFPTKLYTAAKSNQSLQKRYHYLCVDLFAYFRKVVPPTLGPDVTPRDAVNKLFWPSLMTLLPSLRVIVICSDDSDRVTKVGKSCPPWLMRLLTPTLLL